MSKYDRILGTLERSPGRWVQYRYNTERAAEQVRNGVVSVARPRFGHVESQVTLAPQGWLVSFRREA